MNTRSLPQNDILDLEKALSGRVDRVKSAADSRIRCGNEHTERLHIPPGCMLPGSVTDERMSLIRHLELDGNDRSNIAYSPAEEREKLWDHVFGCPYSKGQIRVVTRKSIPAFADVNPDWKSISSSLNRVGRPSGDGEFLRPVGKWIKDLVADDNGYMLLEAAHVLAHARSMACRCGMAYGNGFLECLAEMAIADRYGLTVWCPSPDEIVYGKPCRRSDVESIGIKAVVSTNIRKPWLSTRIGQNGMRPYIDTIAVLVGVHLEPQPWSAREGNPNENDRSWLEMNRWSCMPSLLSISGWMAADELCKAPLVGRNDDSSWHSANFMVPASAMDGPSSLDLYVPCIDLATHEHGMTVDKFISSDLFAGMKSFTPPLPCRECLRLNMSAEGAPTRPVHKRPDPDDKRQNAEAVKEWAEYDAKIDKIFDVVKKASDFHFCRFNEGGRKILKERRKNAKFVSETLGKLKSYDKRARSLASKGFTDKASEIRKKSREAMEKIFSMIERT